MKANHLKLKQKSLILFVLLSFVLSMFQPVFADEQGTLKNLSDHYQKLYQAYLSSVSSGASIEEVQKNLDAYLKAYGEYQRAIGPKTPAPIPESKSSGTPTALSDHPPQAAVAPTTASGLTASGLTESPKTNQPLSWFKSFLTKAKDFLIGHGKFEMPLPEKILWNIGKALLPAFGVMAAAALLAPISPVLMIMGGIVVGASLGGLMTYAYEKRMNAKYRETPKEDAKIWRDVTVQASVEAIMAPFNLATGGLFGMVGPTVGSAIGRVALTQAGLTFAGTALSSQVGGMVKHLWAKHYFHYPEKIAANEKQIDRILETHISSGQPLSEADLKQLDQLRAENDSMRGEDYTHEDLIKDLKRASVSAVISGFAGSIVSDAAYTSESGRWADKISMKIFGTAANGKQISSLISTIPVNFVSGVSNATLEKHFIDKDILDLRTQQSTYKTGSVGYDYYDRLIRQLEEKRESIKVTQAGTDAMVNNFAVRAAQLSVSALKHNLYDGPQARKRAIDEKYRSQDPEWKKASVLYEKYQEKLGAVPNPRNFKSPVAFARAQATYLKQLEASRREWLGQCLTAKNAEGQADRQLVKQQIEVKYDHEVKLNQILELGRLKGGMAHLEAMKTLIKDQNPNTTFTDQDLTKLACQAIAKSYTDKYALATNRVTELESTMKKYDDYKAGRISLTQAEANLLEGQRSLISPSQYKAALVEKQVYELKSGNIRWDDVERRMPEILAKSERMTLDKYGGNWGTVLISEMYANGLAKYKYNPDGSVSFKNEVTTLVKRMPGMVQSGVVSDYSSKVNNAIVGSLIPPASNQQNQFEKYMQSYAKTAITQGTSSVLDGVYNTSKDKIIGGFSSR